MKDNKKYILIIVQIGQHLQNETRKLQKQKKILLKEMEGEEVKNKINNCIYVTLLW